MVDEAKCQGSKSNEAGAPCLGPDEDGAAGSEQWQEVAQPADEVKEGQAGSTGGVDHGEDQGAQAGSTSGTEPRRSS